MDPAAILPHDLWDNTVFIIEAIWDKALCYAVN